MTWSPDNPQGNESAKIKYILPKYTRGQVLELGCGPWRTYPHFTTVDNFTEYTNLSWKPDILSSADELSMFASGYYDSVFSSHLLEHLEDPKASLKEWWRVIKPNGYLILYLPHKDFYPNIGQPGSNPDHLWDFLPKDIITYMKEVAPSFDLVKSDVRSEGNEYSFLQIFKKTSNKLQSFSYGDTGPKEKTCGIVRYGGFGDMIQLGSVLPLLKKKGYHITLYTNPRGEDLLKLDPNVDDFYIQDTNQVPNEELHSFWNEHEQQFDLWINFSETVEGTLLGLPGRSQHRWPKHMKDKMLDVNYLEFMHDYASVPYIPTVNFYPTKKESAWAKKFASNKMGGNKKFKIMWVPSGSAVHKTLPWMDPILATLMIQYPEVEVVIVGSPESTILEQGWEKEPRIHRKSGQMDIRKTLTLADEMDLVVGPETGVLNTVAFNEGVAKIIYLSHSSVNNLTRDWKNCHSLTPTGCECYPCHQMHYNADFCPYKAGKLVRDEGEVPFFKWLPIDAKDVEIFGSDCQVKIAPDSFLDAFTEVHTAWQRQACM